MSFFANVIQWFNQSGLETQAKQLAIKELTQAANDFVTKVQEHAPDMASHVEDQLTSALATAVAGALTRK